MIAARLLTIIYIIQIAIAIIFCFSIGANSIPTEPTEPISFNDSSIKPFEGIYNKMIFSDLTYLTSNIKNNVGTDVILKYELDLMSETTPETIHETTTEMIQETESEIVTEQTETANTEPTEAICESVESIVTDETVSNVSEDNIELLACVIYQEAGGDACCDDCRRRVADIVLNRVADDRFPNTIYDVLTQYNQYGRFYWTGVVWADRANNPYEAAAVDRAKRIAEEVLNGQHSDVYGNGYIWQAGFVQGTDGFWHCGHFYGR